jgi:hypothetical protein
MRSIIAASAFAVLVHPAVLLFTHVAPVAVAKADPAVLLVWIPIALFALAVASAHVLLLGIPLFLLFKRYELLSWPTALLAGGLCGALPIFVSELLGGMSPASGHWASTHRDWKYVASQVAWLGAHGVIGAAVFYAVWRRMQANYAFKRTAGTGHRVS